MKFRHNTSWTLLIFLVLGLSACEHSLTSKETEESGIGESSSGLEANIPDQGAEADPSAEQPAASPEVSPPPGPDATPIPPVNGSPWIHTNLEISHQNIPDHFSANVEVSRQANNLFQSWDLVLPLQQVFSEPDLEVTTSRGTVISFDPLAEIKPQVNSATLHLVRRSSVLPPSDNYLELSFDVSYPTRFHYNASTGFYEDFHPTDWLQFEVVACETGRSCQRILESVPAVSETSACWTAGEGCVRHYEVHIPGAQIPNHGVEFHDAYGIVADGTNAADEVDTNGGARLCSVSDDCTYSHPFCSAGVCSAVHGGLYFKAEVPADLRATGH